MTPTDQKPRPPAWLPYVHAAVIVMGALREIVTWIATMAR